MKVSRWVTALVVLAGVAALAVGPAAASTTKVQSTVTIVSGEGAEFTGKVKSAKKKCRAGRTVKLYRDAGSSRVDSDLVGTAKTNKAGVWTMDGSFFAGVYWAQVLPLLVMIEGERFRCLGDMSIRAHY
jgi:hypothetical protein